MISRRGMKAEATSIYVEQKLVTLTERAMCSPLADSVKR